MQTKNKVVLASTAAFILLGAPLAAALDNDDTEASAPVATQAPTPTVEVTTQAPTPEPMETQTVEPTPEVVETIEPVEEEEPSEAPEETSKPKGSEKDSLTNKSEVKSARENLDELAEDVSDLRHDVKSGSVGWAAWNALEVTFNVGQLEAVDAPESIAKAWNAEIKELVSANDDLSSAIESDSVKNIKSALNSLDDSIEKLNHILDTW